ncbi:MAG TPA: hypothetical protein VI934_00565 [Candidatus Nanoarchaeia archaeon]|nr:hypothetical protein [Candidatus Nanoarchaeia archaeon]
MKVASFFLAAFFAFAAFLHSSYAAAPVIFDGSVLSGYEYKTTLGEPFKLTYVGSQQKVIIDLPFESIIIENKTCETGKKIHGCFDGSTFVGYNYSLPDRLVYQYKIKLSLLAPDIQVNSYLDKSEVEVGEEAIVYVNITNIGTASGTVYFSAKAPDGLKVVELPYQLCQLSINNTLKLIKELIVGEVRHCDYKVVPSSPGSYTLTSSAEFDVINREKKSATSTLKVKNLPLLLNTTLNTQVPLGGQLNLVFRLNTTQQLDFFEFGAFVPGQLSLVSSSKTAKTNKLGNLTKISYGDGVGSFKDNVTLSANFTAKAVGEHIVQLTASWRFNGTRQKIEASYPVNVTFTNPYFRVISHDKQAGSAVVDIVNIAHLPIYDVTASFNGFSEASGKTLSAASIGSQGHARFNLLQKSADADTTGTIRYSTEYGQEIVSTAQLPITLPESVQQAPAGNTSAKNETESAEPAAPAAQEAQPAESPPAPETAPQPGSESNSEFGKSPAGNRILITGLIMAGVIVAIIIVVIFAIRKKQKGTSWEV